MKEKNPINEIIILIFFLNRIIRIIAIDQTHYFKMQVKWPWLFQKYIAEYFR